MEAKVTGMRGEDVEAEKRRDGRVGIVLVTKSASSRARRSRGSELGSELELQIKRGKVFGKKVTEAATAASCSRKQLAVTFRSDLRTSYLLRIL